MERHTCDEKVSHLPQEEPEKDKHKPEIYFPPRRSIVFLPFPHHRISVFTISGQGYFCRCSSSLHPSLIYFGFASILPLLSSLCPLHLMGTSSLQRHNLLSSGQGTQVGTMPRAQNRSVSLIQGVVKGLTGLRSQCGLGDWPAGE